MKELFNLILGFKLKELFYAKTNNSFIQLFRYAFVGGLSFAIDWFVIFLLTGFGLYYLIAAAVAFIFGLATNFILSRLIVFQNGTTVSGTAEFTVYILTGLVGLLITVLLMYLFTDLWGIHHLVSKVLAAAIVLIWNFVARKLILYTNQGAILWKRKKQS